MMKVELVIHKNNKKPQTYHYTASNGYNMHDKVFDALYRNNIEEFTCIEAASWCELACDGETYNEEEFDIYVEWED